MKDFYCEIRLLTLAIEQSADREKMERAAKYFEQTDAEDYAEEYGLGSKTPELTALIQALPADHSHKWYRRYWKGAYGSPETRLAELLDHLDRSISEWAWNACQPVSPLTLLIESLTSVEGSNDQHTQRDVAFLFSQFETTHPIRVRLEPFPQISQYLKEFQPVAHVNLALIGLNREQNRDDLCGRVATLMLKFLRP